MEFLRQFFKSHDIFISLMPAKLVYLKNDPRTRLSRLVDMPLMGSANAIDSVKSAFIKATADLGNHLIRPRLFLALSPEFYDLKSEFSKGLFEGLKDGPRQIFF